MLAGGVSGGAMDAAAGGGAAGDLVFPPGADPRFHWDDLAALADHDLSGQTITILSPWTGPDKALVESVIAYFETATGARVLHGGSDSFEQQILIDAEAGSPPDIAVFPQPGLVADLAAKGHLRPMPADTADWLSAHYAAGDSWAGLARHAGPDGVPRLYAFPYKAELKSLVWYVPENFAEAGLSLPRSQEDLLALSDHLVRLGETPWCIGLGSGGATGWPATDWVEEFMLRLYPPQVYDAWVSHAIPFDDPRVIAAIEAFGAFVRTPGYVAGGPAAVAATDFRDSPAGLFTLPPRCWMHRQASFIPTFFPPGTQIGRDVDFFYFPAYADRDLGQPVLGQPVLGSGAFWARMSDAPAAAVFLSFLRSPLAHEIWMAQSGFLTPHRGVNPDLYGDPTLRKMGAILLGASLFRFDGSDLMPGAIGAGAFWTGMLDYVAGAPAAQVAAQIQKTWDSLD
ncbi:ABC transporter substrate-binding protein [Phaeovulum vinaykumarii]|uniref:ABC transporter substrate-binding protein n=1 Tax=Phaeovulum vinaykumarii TaxID=407234 RepID=UPI0038B3E2AE